MNLIDLINSSINAIIQYFQNTKNLENEEKIKVYISFIEVLYELKGNPRLLYSENDTTKKLKGIIPRLKMFSSKKIISFLDEFFKEINSSCSRLRKEKENIDGLYFDAIRSESDLKSYENRIDELEEKYCLKRDYFEQKYNEFIGIAQKELHIKNKKINTQ